MKRQISQLETDIDAHYTIGQVKTILKLNNLKFREFENWLYGQTRPFVEVGKKMEIGVFGWDLFRYIEAKRKKIEPEFD